MFQCGGQFRYNFGSDVLRNPYDVTVTNDDQMFVAEWSQKCIFIFTLDGNYVNKVSRHVNNPSGIAVDLYGFIFVTEYGENQVSIFDKNGVLINHFGSHNSSKNLFIPRGIACSPNGGIYVCDQSKSIQVYY